LIGGKIPDLIPLDQLSEGETAQPTILPFIFMGIVVLYSIILIIKDNEPVTGPSTPVIIEKFFVQRGWKIPGWLKYWATYSKSPAEEKAFAKIIWSISMFNNFSLNSFTPAEVVREYKSIFPEMSIKIDEILLEYQKAIYSPYPINLKMIQNQSNQILKYSLFKKIKNIFHFRN